MLVALTGATGFIGRQILASLIKRGHRVRALVRSPETQNNNMPAETIRGDLTTGEGLDQLVSGADAVLHSASYIGSDAGLQQMVNVEGTRQLVKAADRARVDRVHYLSTAGVYGGDFPTGGDESAMTPAPRSPLSTSRRDSELLVLQRGGTVIRPNMVIGVGDRWFLGPYLRITLLLDAWIAGGGARVSIINSRHLGELTALLMENTASGGIFHAAYPRPMVIRDLAERVLSGNENATPEGSIGMVEAAARLQPLGVTDNQLAIVAKDNWFDSDRIWKTAALVPPTEPLTHNEAAWYRENLRTG